MASFLIFSPSGGDAREGAGGLKMPFSTACQALAPLRPATELAARSSIHIHTADG
jgi:hypothetical protein